MEMIFSETLPEDIVFYEILPRLPVESLIRFRCVSKDWLKVITNDAAMKKAHSRHHTARSSAEISVLVLMKGVIDRKSQKLLLISGGEVKAVDTSYLPRELIFDQVKSSNGLVLLSQVIQDYKLILWNPATREFRVLPEREVIDDMDFDPDLHLWYDHESDDHKLLRVSETTRVRSLRFQVYSKRSNSWTQLQSLPGFRRQLLRTAGLGVFIAEKIYFLAWQISLCNIVILTFCCRDFTVHGVIIPTASDGRQLLGPESEMGRWKEDSLAVTLLNVIDNEYEFWARTKNGDTGFSWVKLCGICIKLKFCGVWNDRRLIIQSYWYSGATDLLLWDPQTDGDGDNFLVLAEGEPLWRSISANDYVPTLYSVHPDP